MKLRLVVMSGLVMLMLGHAYYRVQANLPSPIGIFLTQCFLVMTVIGPFVLNRTMYTMYSQPISPTTENKALRILAVVLYGAVFTLSLYYPYWSG